MPGSLALPMVDLGSVALLRPWWLVGVPLALLASILVWRGAAVLAGWQSVVDPALLGAMTRRGGVRAGSGRRSPVAAIAAALIALSLVGPAMQRPGEDAFRNLDATVIVLDLSRSVATGGHLAEARVAAHEIAAAAGSRPVALIVYAGDAYLAQPFTVDRAALETTLFSLDGETVPDNGSRPARALALAHDALSEAGVLAGDVFLISDGGGIEADAVAEAERIGDDGYGIHTVFVPPAADRPEVADKGDHTLLEALSAAAGGSTGDVIDIDGLVARAAAPPASRLGASAWAALGWTDYGRLMLVLAIPPMLLMFRRRA